MFLFSEHGAGTKELRSTYDSLNGVLSTAYGLPHNPKDCEEALRILEGSFIDIDDGTVSYINPSSRDYLTEYLNDISILCIFAPAPRKITWAQSLWEFGNREILAATEQQEFGAAFLPIAEQFDRLPVTKRIRIDASTVGLQSVDASNSDRISLMLDWWYVTQDKRFADCVLKVVANPVDGFSGWLHGTDLIRLLTELADPGYGDGFPYVEEVVGQLETRFIDLLESVSIDEFDNISDAVDRAGSAISPSVAAAVERAVLDVVDEIEQFIDCEDSESSLLDYASSLRKWAPRYTIPRRSLDTAMSKIEDRIERIEEAPPTPDPPKFKAPTDVSDQFDDEALSNLFAPLIAN